MTDPQAPPLLTLVSTCEARGINPFAYLADVIPRLQDHPKRRLDELLPGPWSRTRDRGPATLIAPKQAEMPGRLARDLPKQPAC